jgi:glycosyltransferase involved in cell wall biosynthesis
VLHGFVDDVTKHELLAQAWVMALPSIKEGWGLVVGEAGGHAVPTVAYSTAGGTTESIDHKDSGLLVETPEQLTDALRRLVHDHELRTFLGAGALEKSRTFSWSASQAAFAEVVLGA